MPCMPRASRKAPLRNQGLALSANMEDYLEAICVLTNQGGMARVSTIAATLGVKRPSVSKALKRLNVQGLVRHTPYGSVRMTRRGRKVAEEQVRIHRVLTCFLSDVLQLPTELSEHDACLIEHAISPATVERLVEFIDHLEDIGGRTAFRHRGGIQGTPPRTDRSWQSRV